MSTFSYANAVDVTAADAFLPEVWAMETAAAYKANLVMGNLVAKLNHKGKRGDRINIQKPVRAAAQEKAENTVVSPQAHTDTNVAVLLDQHWEYSKIIEDVVELQAMPSLRRFFIEDAGYALAKRIDTELLLEAATFGGGTAYSAAVIGGDGSTAWVQTGAGNGSTLSDAGARRLIQGFDDLDVPTRDRYFVVPPVEKRKLLGLSRFTEQAFSGEAGPANSIRNGRVGDIYGVEVFVSSNLETVDSSNCTSYRPCVFLQRDSMILVEQQAIRMQTQYKLEALGTLLVADVIFGTDTVRGDTATAGDIGAGTKVFMVPAS